MMILNIITCIYMYIHVGKCPANALVWLPPNSDFIHMCCILYDFQLLPSSFHKNQFWCCTYMYGCLDSTCTLGYNCTVHNVILDLKQFSSILHILLICITWWFEVSKFLKWNKLTSHLATTQFLANFSTVSQRSALIVGT